MIEAMRKFNQIFLFVILQTTIITSVCFSQTDWTSTSGPNGGIIESMAKDSEGSIYIAVLNGGVYKSSDNGNNWFPINSGLDNFKIYSVGVDSNDVVYCGSKNGVLYRSTNRGLNWSVKVNLNLIGNIIWDIFVTENNSIFISTSNDGILKSIDGGNIFNNSSSGLPTEIFMQVKENSNGDLFTVSDGGGVFKSTNNGTYWNDITNGLTDPRYTTIDIDNDDNLYIGNANGKGIFFSEDDGRNWISRNTNLPIDWFSVVQKIKMLEDNLLVAALYDRGMYSSSDKGLTWHQYGNNLENNFIFDFIKLDSNEVLTGTFYNGVYKLDLNSNWIESNTNLNHTWIRSLTKDNSGSILSSAFGRGIYKLEENTNQWVSSSSNLATPYIFNITVSPNGNYFATGYDGQYAGTQHSSGVFKSTDLGSTWSKASSGITSQGVSEIAIDKSNNIIYCAGFNSHNLYKSENNGINWISIFAGLPDDQIKAIEVDENNNLLLVAFANAGIFKSTDHGSNWFEINNGLEDGIIGPNAFVQIDDDTDCERFKRIAPVIPTMDRGSYEGLIFPPIFSLKVLDNGELFAGAYGFIFKSTDQGDNWEIFSNGLNNNRILDFETNTYENVLYASSYGTVFKSENNGEEWTDLQCGATNYYIETVLLDTEKNALYAGSKWAGIFNKVEATNFVSATVEIDFVISDGNGQNKTITAGIDPNATDGFDFNFGEELLVGWMPDSNIDARFLIENNVESPRDIKQGDFPLSGIKNYTLEVHPSSGTEITITCSLPDNITGVLRDSDNTGVHNYLLISGDNFITISNADVYSTFDLNISFNGVTPVELTSFSGILSGATVDLSWITATEENNSGFEIERTQYSTNPTNTNWEKIGFVNGNGTSVKSHSYHFVDESISRSDKYLYRLKQIDYDGRSTYSNIIEMDVLMIGEFKLLQNYPNPFNPETTIEFTLPANVKTDLKIYDSIGREIKTIVNEVLEAGQHKINFSSDGLASGVYFYRLVAGDFVATKKLSILK